MAEELKITVTVFDHGKSGVLDFEDKVQLEYRDESGRLVRQDKPVSVKEFLSEQSPGELGELNVCQKFNLISQSEDRPKGLLNSARWFFTDISRKKLPVDNELQKYVDSNHKKLLARLLGISNGLASTIEIMGILAGGTGVAWVLEDTAAISYIRTAGKSLVASPVAIAAAKVTGAFLVGAAIGMCLEKAQQATIGTSISELGGDWAHKTFGPAKQSNIDWFDKYFGWLP